MILADENDSHDRLKFPKKRRFILSVSEEIDLLVFF